MMKLFAPELFLKAKSGRLSLAEARDFLRFMPDKDREQNMGWEECWWTYLLANPLPEHLKDFGRELRFSYNFREPRDIVRFTADEIIDRLAVSSAV